MTKALRRAREYVDLCRADDDLLTEADCLLAALVAEIDAAPSGELFAAYPIGSRDFALADDRGESIDLRPYVGQTVRLLALDSEESK